MKHIKLYESFNRKLKIGDYVVTGQKIDASYQRLTIDEYEIGQLENIVSGHYWFRFHGEQICLGSDQILYWSESKEELETILTSKKYNL